MASRLPCKHEQARYALKTPEERMHELMRRAQSYGPPLVMGISGPCAECLAEAAMKLAKRIFGEKKEMLESKAEKPRLEIVKGGSLQNEARVLRIFLDRNLDLPFGLYAQSPEDAKANKPGELIARSVRGRTLADWAFETGAVGVRHDYDLKEDDR